MAAVAKDRTGDGDENPRVNLKPARPVNPRRFDEFTG